MADTNDALALLRQYLAARYRVMFGDEILDLAIGAPVAHAGLEAGAPYAFITAWNPRSMAQSRAANDLAQRGLDDLLADDGATLYGAIGGDPDGRWEEGSTFAVGVALEMADRLAARFEQNAIVAGTVGQPARLRVYRLEWREHAAAAGLDTAFVDWVASPPATTPPAH